MKTRAADDVDAIYARMQQMRRERALVELEKAKVAQAEAAAALAEKT